MYRREGTLLSLVVVVAMTAAVTEMVTVEGHMVAIEWEVAVAVEVEAIIDD